MRAAELPTSRVHALPQAVSRVPGAESLSVRLGTASSLHLAQLDGFKSRVLRATSSVQQHMYVAEWRPLVSSTVQEHRPAALVLSRGTADAPLSQPLSTKAGASPMPMVIAAVAMQRGQGAAQLLDLVLLS